MDGYLDLAGAGERAACRNGESDEQGSVRACVGETGARKLREEAKRPGTFPIRQGW